MKKYLDRNRVTRMGPDKQEWGNPFTMHKKVEPSWTAHRSLLLEMVVEEFKNNNSADI